MCRGPGVSQVPEVSKGYRARLARPESEVCRGRRVCRDCLARLVSGARRASKACRDKVCPVRLVSGASRGRPDHAVRRLLPQSSRRLRTAA